MNRLLLIAILSCFVLGYAATASAATTAQPVYTLDGKQVTGDVILNQGKASGTWSLNKLFGHHLSRPIQYKTNTCFGKTKCKTSISRSLGRNSKTNSSFANLN
ncbi:MAG: hypothetical protein PW788_04450 [Micavibrio sp.]|nr:hypothetical protein [Micavibrio sp.]